MMSSVSNTPSSSQQFCLKWNNHGINLVRTLTEMVGEGNFVDVTLACEGSSIKAHKMVLSACSNYFKELFLSNPCQHPIVILKDMKIDELRGIIDFMYKGEVNVSQNQLGALLKTAEILKVKGLTEVNDDDDEKVTNSNISNCNNSNNNNNLINTSNNNNNNNNVNNINTGERKNGSLIDEQTVINHQNNNNASLTVTQTRKKKRRRVKKNTSSSGDDASGSDNGPSSEDEETVDVPSLKRAKDNIQSSSHHNQQSQHQTQVQMNIPDNIPIVTTNRRRTQMQQNLNQVQTQLCLTQGESLENSNDANLDDSSEAWIQRQSSSVTGQITTDADEESDDMIDVKPIISFDEGSVGSMNNSLALALPNEVGNSMDVCVMSPSTQNTPTGKICVCHLCHLTFTAYSSLRRHMQRHYADRERYECDICLKSYSRKDYLKEHKKLKHGAG